MGGFFLYKKDSIIDEAKAADVFLQRGFSDPVRMQLGDYVALVYPKIITRAQIHVAQADTEMTLCGTMIYRGKSIALSADLLLTDFIANSINEHELLGHFICIIFHDGKLTLLTDKLALLAVYYHRSLPIISSSFLAITNVCSTPVSLSKQAVLEIILAQGVLPPDTQCEEIKRYTPSQRLVTCPCLELFRYKQESYTDNPLDTFKDAVNGQIARLDTYFELVKSALIENGVMTGLSGGFDSRLLLAMLLRHGITPVAYTHWQHGRSRDYLIASEIAKHLNVDLLSVKEHERHSAEDGDRMLKGFLFTDAQCRNQYYWNEIYSSYDYYRALNPKVGMGLNGVGGEQYRNQDWINHRTYPIRKWLKKEIYPYANRVLASQEFDGFEGRYVDKIKDLIGCNETIDILGFKKFHNIVYGYANRYYRASFENQVMHHLSPFCDPFLSQYAYRAIPNLGNLFAFQSEMIRKITPELSKVDSSYGFPFSKNPPSFYRFMRSISNRVPKTTIMHVKYLLSKAKHVSENDSRHQDLSSLNGLLDFNKLPQSFEFEQILGQLAYMISRIQGTK